MKNDVFFYMKIVIFKNELYFIIEVNLNIFNLKMYNLKYVYVYNFRLYIIINKVTDK
jgi:hypothetical protein